MVTIRPYKGYQPQWRSNPREFQLRRSDTRTIGVHGKSCCGFAVPLASLHLVHGLWCWDPSQGSLQAKAFGEPVSEFLMQEIQINRIFFQMRQLRDDDRSAQTLKTIPLKGPWKSPEYTPPGDCIRGGRYRNDHATCTHGHTGAAVSRSISGSRSIGYTYSIGRCSSSRCTNSIGRSSSSHCTNSIGPA